MKKMILCLLLAPLFTFAQNTSIFIKLIDASGQQIKGESIVKGLERYIQPTSTSASGRNNTQFNFSMTVSAASAELKKAMATGQLLPNGTVEAFISSGGGAPVLSYNIKMEELKVLACSESMGCNGITNTTVSLQATRIGWTYYSPNPKGGPATISSKFGWDASANREWLNF
jgi:type VI protein secretion system component Hcp